jgi:hypothetical protein
MPRLNSVKPEHTREQRMVARNLLRCSSPCAEFERAVASHSDGENRQGDFQGDKHLNLTACGDKR